MPQRRSLRSQQARFLAFQRAGSGISDLLLQLLGNRQEGQRDERDREEAAEVAALKREQELEDQQRAAVLAAAAGGIPAGAAEAVLPNEGGGLDALLASLRGGERADITSAVGKGQLTPQGGVTQALDEGLAFVQQAVPQPTVTSKVAPEPSVGAGFQIPVVANEQNDPNELHPFVDNAPALAEFEVGLPSRGVPLELDTGRIRADVFRSRLEESEPGGTGPKSGLNPLQASQLTPAIAARVIAQGEAQSSQFDVGITSILEAVVSGDEVFTGIVDESQKPTDGELNAASLMGRALALLETIDRFERNLPRSQLITPRLWQSDEAQLYVRAVAGFVNVVKILESGAAIRPDELQTALEQYSLRFSDTTASRESLSQLRMLAVKGGLIKAGIAAPQAFELARQFNLSLGTAAGMSGDLSEVTQAELQKLLDAGGQ